jgi:hypothetical protein
VARRLGRQVVARLQDDVDLHAVAAKAKAQAGSGFNGPAHRLVWGLIHRYAADKGGSLGGSRYEAGRQGLALEGKTIVIGDDAIGRVAGGDADGVGRELQTLLGATPAAEEPRPAAPAPPTSQSSARDIILERARKAVGAVEGSAEFSQYVAEPKALAKAREDAAAKNRKHTTCIDFFTRAWGLVRESRKQGAVPRLPNLYAPASHPGWVEASPGMPDAQRPAAGDIYILSQIKTEGGKEKKGSFSHVGIIESTAPHQSDADREVWVTIDAGQPGGEPGLEKVDRSNRIYVKSTNRITGEKLQGSQERLLTGWWNVDLLAK